MITMFKNEAKVIRRMLESCYKHIDFYVIQNNGSTDGTDLIVKEFFEEKQIPGVLYNVEEGWKGFGWNRDHLIQTCQSIDHGCDWILKMDCDEELEVDDDFDWSPFDNKETTAFHITAVSGTAMYYRAWIWNASKTWRFNHDPCHETIYIQDGDKAIDDFPRVNLSSKIRHRGFNEGESWSIATKYITDSLVLEEKMIRENTMLGDRYHFWYIGKSYFDSYKSPAFPLQLTHQQEYARRCIFYFDQYVNHFHANSPIDIIDEMAYFALVFGAEAHRFLGEYDKAIENYKRAPRFAPRYNDHLFGLATLYDYLKQYENMAVVTTEMMDPTRTNPFPEFGTFVDTSLYHDSPTNKVQELHKIALQNIKTAPNLFSINTKQKSRLFVVDNFYDNPDMVRDYALSVEYNKDNRWYKGTRSTVPYRPDGIKQAFEKIIGQQITTFEDHSYNGVFQLMVASDPQVYHFDMQKWAAIIYLTPNAPTESGTRLHKSRINGTRHSSEPFVDKAFEGNFYDATRFDTIDVVANIYNRLVIMDAQCIHSAGPYFGSDMTNGRLTHLFFFD